MQSLAQLRMVSGRVTDEKGTPVPKASVRVDGTRVGTTSDTLGYYTINIPPHARFLHFSSVNMEPKEIVIGSQSIINIYLSPFEQTMGEVVVVAYGTQKKTNLTGSLNTVNSTFLENKPLTSVDKTLQGAVPGLQSVAASGAPGSNQQIRIRGIGSINANANPLWVIDGIPLNSGDVSRLTTTANLLSTLNPNDIDQITVLKDAAASSIYGSRGANGVILITTRKGKAGKTRYRFDSEAGQSDIAYLNDTYQPLDANDYFILTREGLLNAGLATTANVDSIMTATFGYGNGVNTNWLDENTRKGKQSLLNLSASGGNERTTFYLSGGYFRQEGITLQTDFKKYTASVGIDNKASNKLHFGANANAGYVRQNVPLSGSFFANPVWGSFQILSSISPYNADGSLNIDPPDFGPSSYNTVALAQLDKRLLKQVSLRGNVNADYRIIENLRLFSSFGIDYNILEEDQYNNPFHGGGVPLGRAYGFLTRFFNWVFTNRIEYGRSIDKAGHLNFDVKLGYESQKSNGYFISAQSQNMPPTVDITYAIAGASPVAAGSTIAEYSFLSALSMANLNYRNKILFSGSYRRDGSSRFGINNRYGDFWSVGAAWNIDQEPFMQHVEFIDQLKIRVSYGVNGNAGIANYAWRPLYGFGFNYNQQPGGAPLNTGNNDLTWEMNKPLNIGLDISMFKKRINFSIDYYVRKTSGILLAAPVSRTTGFSVSDKNIGSMENKGVEILISSVPLRMKDFEWSLGGNFAINKNQITSLINDQDIVDGIFIRRVGEDLQSFYLRPWAGVDTSNGDPLWFLNLDSSKTGKTNNWNSATRVLSGSASPKYFGSLSSGLKFKNWALDIMFYYSFGNYVRDSWGGFYMGSGMGGGFNKIRWQFEERWQKPGDYSIFPKYVFDGNKLAHNPSTFYLFKGGFVRLRDITLSYRIAQAVIQKLGATNAVLYIRGNNIWTWVQDKRLGFDPEQGVTSQTNMEVFIPKTITIGFNLGF